MRPLFKEKLTIAVCRKADTDNRLTTYKNLCDQISNMNPRVSRFFEIGKSPMVIKNKITK